MRATTALFVLLFSFSAQAAKVQVRHCGDTLRQVANIVNQQFGALNSGDLVACFKADWGYGVKIELDEVLNFGGYQFEACPQSNGQIYLHKKNDPQDGGMLKCTSTKMTAAGFKGALAVANGDYSRQGSQVANARKNRN